MFWRASFCSTRRITQSKFITGGALLLCLLFYLKFKSLEDSNNAALHHQQQQQQLQPHHRQQPPPPAHANAEPQQQRHLQRPHSPRLFAIDADTTDVMAVHQLPSGESTGGDADANATLFEALIAAELRKQRPKLGDDGHEVVLEGEAARRGAAQMKKIALNQEVSEQLRYNRTLPDVRNPLCKRLQYDLEALPTASVIIIFYNEPYSVLLRTVHSVITNSDARVLKEIILVDDFSDQAPLQGELEYYMRTRLPDLVKIVRLKSRLGLIRARLAGARIARGDVLVFLDAHCECIVDWLNPMLQRIKDSRTSVLVPIIDVIDADDFHYSVNGFRHFQIGGFKWDGHFTWINVSPRERKRIATTCTDAPEICPTHSPTMAGGLFAIERAYFWEIGSYDEQMDGWGGENLEMSFRIWQCGGTIETIPCSRVGHIFRNFHPYKFPNGRDTHGINTVRMAEVWMDEYVKLFYMNRPDMRDHPAIGDVTHRRILRDKLKCRDFGWYLRNVYPEKFVPTQTVQYYGRVQARSANLCLDDLQADNEEPYNLGVYTCIQPEVSRSQFFSLTDAGELRNEMSCATLQSRSHGQYIVVMAPCLDQVEKNNRWEMAAGHMLRQRQLDVCLDHRGLQPQDHLIATTCNPDSESQRWDFVNEERTQSRYRVAT